MIKWKSNTILLRLVNYYSIHLLTTSAHKPPPRFRLASHFPENRQNQTPKPTHTQSNNLEIIAAMDVRLHTYYPRRTLNLSEYIPRLNLTQPRQEQHQPPNVLLFIGGMYDNFRSPKYVDDLAALFPRDEPDQKWSVFHVQLSSAGKCFGLVDLNRDVGVKIFTFRPLEWLSL